MHPGPINRGVEIDSELADSEQSVILHQVMTDGIQQISPTDTLLTQVQVIKDGDATSLADPLDTIDGLTFAGALAMSS